MTNSPLFALSLTDASEALAAGTLTSRHLTEACLARIAAVQDRVHAFALVTPALALADADRADAERAAGRIRGPLHGLPIAVKDAIDDAEAPATFGNPALHGGRCGREATVTRRLKAAGMVRLGKLTLTEGVWVQHHSSVAEPVNPYGAAFWTGNSSSGSGVALAAGMTPASVGTDTGGSIRLPSGCCGVTGLKPGWGRISVAGVHPLAPSLDTVGPMARSARDVALLMDALAGADPEDPTALAAASELCQVVGRVELRGLTIGVPSVEIAQSDAAVQSAMAEAVAVLTSLGATLVDIDMPQPGPVIDAWSVLISAEAARTHRDTFPARSEVYGDALTALITRGAARTNAEIIDAMAVRRRHIGEMAALYRGVDALLVPALPVGGPSNAFMASFASDDEATQVIGRYTAPFNMCGLPTLTLPCGRSDAGIPIGMQICGPRFSEPLLCRIGAAYQDVTDWHGIAAL